MFLIEKKEVDFGGEAGLDWNTTCPFCDAQGTRTVYRRGSVHSYEQFDNCTEEEEEECEHCENGYYPMYYNHVWAIEIGVSEEQRKAADEAGSFVIYSPEGDAYLAMAGGGMDMTPYLMNAWVALGFGWLPLQWVLSVGNKADYLSACLGKKDANEVKDLMVKTLDSMVERCMAIRRSLYKKGG